MKYGLLTVLSLSFIGSFGQDYFDLGRFSYSRTPKSAFEQNSVSTDIVEATVEFNLPLVLADKTTLITGIFGSVTQLRLDPELADASKLYALGITLGINHRYNEVWNATYMLVPKIAADFQNGMRKGAQLGLLALVERTRSVRLKHSLGLFVNKEAYGPLIVPLLGLYYRSQDDRFETNVLLPIRVDLNYQLGKVSWLGVNFDGIGTSYSIDNQLYNNNYINKSSNELYSYFRYRITTALLLDFKLGYAFFRSYRVFDQSDQVRFSLASLYFGDDRTQLNANFDDSAIFKIDLHYRFYFNSK